MIANPMTRKPRGCDGSGRQKRCLTTWATKDVPFSTMLFAGKGRAKTKDWPLTLVRQNTGGANAAALIEMQTQHAALSSETARVEGATGPIRYLAVMLGTDSETAVRWLILLMVLCCDPAAIALTIAVAGARKSRS
jgi:hypothetical protein